MIKFDIEEVREFIINSSKESKIYIGADSEVYKTNGVWMADYIVVVAIHIDGNKGCKLFGEVTSERIYDSKKDKPRLRLMTEVMKCAEMYTKLADVIEDHHVEVHLDINPVAIHGSSCVLSEAVGYIRGMCNVIPMVKPNAFCASFGADRYKEIKALQK